MVLHSSSRKAIALLVLLGSLPGICGFTNTDPRISRAHTARSLQNGGPTPKGATTPTATSTTTLFLSSDPYVSCDQGQNSLLSNWGSDQPHAQQVVGPTATTTTTRRAGSSSVGSTRAPQPKARSYYSDIARPPPQQQRHSYYQPAPTARAPQQQQQNQQQHQRYRQQQQRQPQQQPPQQQQYQPQQHQPQQQQHRPMAASMAVMITAANKRVLIEELGYPRRHVQGMNFEAARDILAGRIRCPARPW